MGNANQNFWANDPVVPPDISFDDLIPAKGQKRSTAAEWARRRLRAALVADGVDYHRLLSVAVDAAAHHGASAA
jgi:hypothetical protein